MSLRDLWNEVVSIHHGVRAAEEWHEQDGGDASDGTLAALAEELGAQNVEAFASAFDHTLERQEQKALVREQGGLKGFLFG